MRFARDANSGSSGMATALICRAALFAGGVLICLHYSPVHRTFSFDNQIYFYIAERVASGEPPHVSLVDHKHQLASILSGWAMVVGRLADVEDYLSARILSVGLAAACVPLLWGIGRRLGGSLWAANLTGLAMLGFVDFFYQGTMGVRPKVFMAFFLVLALSASSVRKNVASGAAATAAFLCWQPAAIVPAGLGIVCWFGPAKARRFAAFVGGCVAVLLAYEAYFVLHGALREQLFQSYLMPADLSAYKHYSLSSTLWFILNMGLWRRDWGRLYPALASTFLLTGWLWASLHPRRFLSIMKNRPEILGVLLCAHGALVFTFIDRQAYPDMFFLYPYIALTVGVGLAAVIGGLTTRGWTVSAAALGLLASAFLIATPYYRLPLFAPPRRSIAVQQTAARQLDIIREQYGSIWAVGCPHLLAFNHWRNHTPFGLLIDRKVHTYMKRTSGDRPWRPLLDGRLPGAILLSRGGYGPELFGWIRREYREVSNRSFLKQGIHLWVARAHMPEGLPSENGRRPAVPSRRQRSGQPL